MEAYSTELVWLVLAGFVFAFVLAFGIGANDVANSFGTSVGSKVLTLTQACILATIFEIAGAVLIGYKVSDTMRKGILDVELYADGGERQLAAGCLAALVAGAAWLLLATALGLPVSGTHSVVGATVGFTLAAKGAQGIRWATLGAIVLSWFISPALSGAMSALLYWLIRRLVLRAAAPLHAALLSLPFFYGGTVLVNVLSVVHDGPKLLHMDGIPVWMAVTVSLALGALVAVLVQLLLVPYYRRVLLEDKPPVNFTLGASNETTPANTPIHTNNGSAKRPTSLLSDDGKVLEAIAETSEMVTLSDVEKASLGLADKGRRHCALLATMEDCSILSRSLSPPRQRLHLSDADPQLHTLKYIDETMSWCRSIDSSQLAGIGDSYETKNGFLGSCDTVAQGDTDRRATMPSAATANPPVHHLVACPSAWSVEAGLINPGLTPNSSAVPLLAQRAPAVTPTSQTPPPPQLLRVFSFLQILTATFGGFAHGGNDVSNAIGPLIALWLLYSEGATHARAETPLGILLYGGVGIAMGLWLWGRRVIKTVGEDLTNITPDTGFTIELGAALTVLVASKAGLPVSTTHCKVGSVVFVGALSSDRSGVDWKLFRNIILAWVVTVPAVAGLSALIMVLLELFVV